MNKKLYTTLIINGINIYTNSYAKFVKFCNINK